MGCPEKYYKKVLQSFAYTLNVFVDKKLADKMFIEESEEVLENEINKQKNVISKEEFYFNAGRSYEVVLGRADRNDGCDGFNACIGGLNDFCEFIGLEE